MFVKFKRLQATFWNDMMTIVFLSAVSEEFHRPDDVPTNVFESYRDVLAQALCRCGGPFTVIVQEELAQGFGDLLQTLEDEIGSAHSALLVPRLQQ
jgi:hypothetical protein